MLTLYFCPGACSTAAHIALEETGAPYQGTPVLIPKGEHQTEAYAAVNPRHQVPALSVDGKVITECVAILAYVAQDNEALLVLTQLDDRSLQDLGIVRTAYMRAASNLPSTE